MELAFSRCVLIASVSITLLGWSLACSANPYQHLLSSLPAGEVTAQLDFNSHSPHIFSSLRYLLRQWPNTFLPNGYSIVPCEVPPFTPLYHGRTDNLLPASPEWLAFDIEMAYGIMGSTQCSRMLTYQTMRRAKCLYFDGMSAGLLNMSQLHSQMLLLYGNLTGPLGVDEYGRAVDLCRWVATNSLGGSGWGIEGIVRMNAGFEMMWCNFSSPSIELVDSFDVTAPQIRTDHEADAVDTISAIAELMWKTSVPEEFGSSPVVPPTAQESATTPAYPPTWPDVEQARRHEPYFDSQAWEWFRSATRQYGRHEQDSEENRIWLFTCGFMSFYDPVFEGARLANTDVEGAGLNPTSEVAWKVADSTEVASQHLRFLSMRRRWHDLAKSNEKDGQLMSIKAKRVLQDFISDERMISESRCSGADWHFITKHIALRFSNPLLELTNLISLLLPQDRGKLSGLRVTLRETRSLLHATLLPVFEYPHTAFRTDLPEAEHNATWSMSSELAWSTFARCKMYYTKAIAFRDQNSVQISVEEKLIIESIEEVMSAICGTLIPIFFSIENTWLTNFNSLISTKEFPNAVGDYVVSSARTWAHQLRMLHAWLGWEPDRISCPGQCGLDEVCYIPMWPLRLSEENGKRIVHDPDAAFQDEEELWNPQCVKMGRVAGDENPEA